MKENLLFGREEFVHVVTYTISQHLVKIAIQQTNTHELVHAQFWKSELLSLEGHWITVKKLLYQLHIQHTTREIQSEFKLLYESWLAYALDASIIDV